MSQTSEVPPDSSEFYTRNSASYIERTVNLDATSLHKPFLELLPPGGHILDGGCGSGRDAFAFIKQGFIVTAFDASVAMVKAAKRLTGLPVLQLRFQDMAFKKMFDGIWTCASLLHVPKQEISDAFDRFICALKPNGYWYMSFKYGEGEEIRSGRLFNNHTEYSLKQVIAQHDSIEIARMWMTNDLRDDRKNEKWLNTIVQRKVQQIR